MICMREGESDGSPCKREAYVVGLGPVVVASMSGEGVADLGVGLLAAVQSKVQTSAVAGSSIAAGRGIIDVALRSHAGAAEVRDVGRLVKSEQLVGSLASGSLQLAVDGIQDSSSGVKVAVQHEGRAQSGAIDAVVQRGLRKVRILQIEKFSQLEYKRQRR
jgi:hypothetical protein